LVFGVEAAAGVPMLLVRRPHGRQDSTRTRSRRHPGFRSSLIASGIVLVIDYTDEVTESRLPTAGRTRVAPASCGGGPGARAARADGL
jgi:hypothetical protein